MPKRGLVTALVTFIVVFMTVTLVIALIQEEIAWGWWWVVPVGFVFVAAILGFRILVQRSVEAADRADRDLDEFPGQP